MNSSTNFNYLVPVKGYLEQLEGLSDIQVIEGLKEKSSKKPTTNQKTTEVQQEVQKSSWSLFSFLTPRSFSTAPTRTRANSNQSSSMMLTPRGVKKGDFSVELSSPRGIKKGDQEDEKSTKRKSLTTKQMTELEFAAKKEIYSLSQDLKAALLEINSSFSAVDIKSEAFQTAVKTALTKIAQEDTKNNNSQTKIANAERLKNLSLVFSRYEHLKEVKTNMTTSNSKSVSKKIYAAVRKVFVEFKFRAFITDLDAILKHPTAYKALVAFAQTVYNDIPLKAVHEMTKLCTNAKSLHHRNSSDLLRIANHITDTYFNVKDNDLNIPQQQIEETLEKLRQYTERHNWKKQQKQLPEVEGTFAILTPEENLKNLDQENDNLILLEDLENEKEVGKHQSVNIQDLLLEPTETDMTTTNSSNPIDQSRGSMKIEDIFGASVKDLKFFISQDTVTRFVNPSSPNKFYTQFRESLSDSAILELEVDWARLS